MKKRVLFSATVDSHIKFFHLPYLQYFKSQGYEVCVATNGRGPLPFCDKKYTIPITKSPFKLTNLKAYKELRTIIDHEEFDLIHCHMPMAAVITRLAARKARKKGTKVIYTAHGFHFFRGAPLISWLIYYPVEKMMARYTDCLITINHEDYTRAKTKKFRAKQTEIVDGIGVDLSKFKPVSLEKKAKLRSQYNYNNDAFILVYVAELTKRKNQEALIKSTVKLKEVIKNLKVLIVGEDSMAGYYQRIAKKLGIENEIDFLGLRQDVPQLLNIADMYVSVSKQEGLPINIIEAMGCGLPICATKVRGHVDLIQHNKNGILISLDNEDDLSEGIIQLYNDSEQRELLGKQARRDAKRYALETVYAKMIEIYEWYK